MTAIAKSELPCLDGIIKTNLRRLAAGWACEVRTGRPTVIPDGIDFMRADQLLRRLGEAGFEVSMKKPEIVSHERRDSEKVTRTSRMGK